jgi:hypothetical protein
MNVVLDLLFTSPIGLLSLFTISLRHRHDDCPDGLVQAQDEHFGRMIGP